MTQTSTLCRLSTRPPRTTSTATSPIAIPQVLSPDPEGPYLPPAGKSGDRGEPLLHRDGGPVRAERRGRRGAGRARCRRAGRSPGGRAAADRLVLCDLARARDPGLPRLVGPEQP